MACIEKIYSVSALVGTGLCNANCSFCAGKALRVERTDTLRYHRNLEAAIKLSARYGGWSLSLTSAGEPTCEPLALTQALEVYAKCAKQGAYFPNVNLFTNGILFADDVFCQTYLAQWRELGLTNVAVSVHDTTEAGQAKAYSIPHYPAFEQIFNNIRAYGLGVRCTLLLRRREPLAKDSVDSAYTYEQAVQRLLHLGVDNISSWPVGNPDGTRNEYTPSRLGLWSIRHWLHRHARLCHGHIWGGGVYDYKGNILRYTSYVTKHNPRKDFVRQLVVFGDGTVAYSWIRAGALCLK